MLTAAICRRLNDTGGNASIRQAIVVSDHRRFEPGILMTYLKLARLVLAKCPRPGVRCTNYIDNFLFCAKTLQRRREIHQYTSCIAPLVWGAWPTSVGIATLLCLRSMQARAAVCRTMQLPHTTMHLQSSSCLTWRAHRRRDGRVRRLGRHAPRQQWQVQQSGGACRPGVRHGGPANARNEALGVRRGLPQRRRRCHGGSDVHIARLAIASVPGQIGWSGPARWEGARFMHKIRH